MLFGDILKALRENKDLKQEDIAKFMNVDRSTVGKWESSSSKPDYEKLVKLASFYGVSTDYLLGNSDIKNPYIEDDLPDDFNTPEEAMDFLLNKNVIMGFTGFDIHSLTDEEKTQYARDLLDHLKLLSLKYKK